jgi:hypothetical protein
MRTTRLLLLVATLLVASSAFASLWPRFDTDHVLIHEGETQTIRVSAAAGGFGFGITYPFQPWVFESSNRRVALVAGTLDDPSSAADVTITGVAPGKASVWWKDTARVLITVLPRPVRVTIAPSALKTTVGRSITLLAQSESSPLTFHWYAGPVGDTSQPLQGDDDELTFTPATPGRYQFWVSAVGQHGMNNDAVTIDVDPAPRRRSAQH